MSAGNGGALQGVKVVDLSRVLAGPLCTQMLADHGADVIKVEPPAGDETRMLGPPFDSTGSAAYFLSLNRGKRAISLDLSLPQGQDVLHRLLADADVLVENFLPGTLERWGIGYEQCLRQRYPRLVHCSISGFGADGPLGGLPGYDAVLQAMCGVMSVNGDPGSSVRVGVPLVDHLTGYVALSGILMALHSRNRTGSGQRVEATLFDAGLSLLVPHASNWFLSGKTPGLLGSAHPNIAPYDKFRAKDGELFIGILNEGQFRRFCSKVGLDALPADPRFSSNAQRLAHRDALKQLIEEAIADVDRAPLCEALMRAGVPAGSVNSVPEALSHPHAEHRRMVVREGEYAGLRSPIRLEQMPGGAVRPPPRYSQDTDEILAGLGFSADERAELRSRGVTPRPDRQTDQQP